MTGLPSAVTSTSSPRNGFPTLDRGDRELVAVGVRVVAEKVQHERTGVLGHRERVVRCDRSVGDGRHRADDLGRRAGRAVARLVGEADRTVVVACRLERDRARRIDPDRAHRRIAGGDGLTVGRHFDVQAGRCRLPFDRGDRQLVAVRVRVVAEKVQHARTGVLGHRERVVRRDRSVGDGRHRADDLGSERAVPSLAS